MNDMREIGILGGTFDPIHNGHLAIAGAVRDALGLDRVLFIPTGRPWLKSGLQITAAVHRLTMVQLAIYGHVGFEVSDIETERPGLTYTVDTLEELGRRFGDRSELYLVLGMDSVRELRRWHCPERLFELCTVVAVSRPGVVDVAVEELEREFTGSVGRFDVVPGPLVDVSATEIRKRASRRESIGNAVPEPVERYIREQGLYDAFRILFSENPVNGRPPERESGPR